MIENQLQVGDVIEGDSRFVVPLVDSDGRMSITNYQLTLGGIGVGLPDPSRNGARFVVEEANMAGGGTAMGSQDIYYGGWHIIARRLRDGVYDPAGEVIDFYQSGDFSTMIDNILVVGKLTKVIDFR